MWCAFRVAFPRTKTSFPRVAFMTRTLVSSLVVPRRLVAIGLVLAATVLAGSADAGPRRARLSRDLSDRLAKGDAAVTSVIVEWEQRED